MTDVLTPEQRRKNMRAIKSRNTSPEIFIRRLLFSHGYRYRLNNAKIPGSPDIFLRKYNTAVFVHGCFWHRHKNCRLASTPSTNYEKWQKKFQANIKRDNDTAERLREAGIKRLVIWECTVRKMKRDENLRNIFLEHVKLFFQDKTLTESEF